MEAAGELPLPPYIDRPEGNRDSDQEDYQTLFAKELGAVAAPTASLHFTETVLSQIEERGIQRAEITLHVGPHMQGNFCPLNASFFYLA